MSPLPHLWPGAALQSNLQSQVVGSEAVGGSSCRSVESRKGLILPGSDTQAVEHTADFFALPKFCWLNLKAFEVFLISTDF